MSWVKLDDGFADHPKILTISDSAFRLHVAALCWTSRRGTDGRLIQRDLRVLSTYLHHSDVDVSALVAELVTAGIWDLRSGEWEIHNYLKYNPSAAKVEAEREAAKQRMQSARLAKLERSPSGGLSSPSRPVPSRPSVSKETENKAPSPREIALDALYALCDGLCPPGLQPSDTWQAFGSRKYASTTGLPPDTENAWFGVWEHLSMQDPAPSMEDMVKLGRWWAKGGAALCKKPRFTYLRNVPVITDWFARSQAWDGKSDPTPTDPTPQRHGARSGPFESERPPYQNLVELTPERKRNRELIKNERERSQTGSSS